jgi:hypothetical protein
VKKLDIGRLVVKHRGEKFVDKVNNSAEGINLVRERKMRVC